MCVCILERDGRNVYKHYLLRPETLSASKFILYTCMHSGQAELPVLRPAQEAGRQQ